MSSGKLNLQWLFSHGLIASSNLIDLAIYMKFLFVATVAAFSLYFLLVDLKWNEVAIHLSK